MSFKDDLAGLMGGVAESLTIGTPRRRVGNNREYSRKKAVKGCLLKGQRRRGRWERMSWMMGEIARRETKQ